MRKCQCTCGLTGCASRREDAQVSRRMHGTYGRYRAGCHCDRCKTAAYVKKTAKVTKNQTITGGPAAPKSHQLWTGAELEIALRDDLRVVDLALMLGRSYAAVQAARIRARTDPKWIKVVGEATRAD